SEDARPPRPAARPRAPARAAPHPAPAPRGPRPVSARADRPHAQRPAPAAMPRPAAHSASSLPSPASHSCPVPPLFIVSIGALPLPVSPAEREGHPTPFGNPPRRYATPSCRPAHHGRLRGGLSPRRRAQVARGFAL